MTISVVVVDDHPLFRKGLEHLLNAAAEVKIAGQFADIESTRAWLAAKGTADVVLLDRSLRDADGLVLVPDFKARGIKVIMLTIAEEDHEIRDAIERGVDGYILKSSEPEQIIQAIHSVHGGNSMLPSQDRKSVV